MEPLHEVRIDRHPHALALVLEGEIDLSAVDDVTAQGKKALADANLKGRLVLDLSQTTFLDSSGVGALVRLRNIALAEGGPRLELKPGPPNVMRVLDLVGLADAFDPPS